MKNVKYLHIAFQDGGGNFISKILSAFKTEDFNTSLEEHMIITNDYNIFNEFRNEYTIVFSKDDMVKNINKYGKKAKWIIIHGFSVPPHKILFIKKKLNSRIIWRTWGHDLNAKSVISSNFLKTIYRLIVYRLFIKKIKKFNTIGIANIVDDLKVRSVLGNDIDTFLVPYCSSVKDNIELTNNFKYMLDNYKKDDDICRIMVGHSSNPSDNHIEIIKKIEKFINEKILVYVMLPYGDSNDASYVKKNAINILGEKCIIIDRKIPENDYYRFIFSMDIAIMDMKKSAALGNITMLVSAGKKIYLNKNGDVYLGLKQANIPCYSIDSIESEDYEQFIKMDQYDIRKACNDLSFPYDNPYFYCDLWNQFFKKFN